MKEMTDAVRRMLKEKYNEACNYYSSELMNMWEINALGYWVSNKAGGVFCFCDTYISMDEIIYCVDEDVTFAEFREHTEYCMKCVSYNINSITLKDWHEGAKRIPQDMFDRLDELKKSLEDEIENIKSKF